MKIKSTFIASLLKMLQDKPKQPEPQRGEVNIMLDLETMSAESNAAIIEIGACVFDINTGEIGDTFCVLVDLRDSAKHGNIDASTVLWWLKQSDDARKNITSSKGLKLKAALQQFEAWIKPYGFMNTYVWGLGDDFDNVILANAYKTLNMRVPFNTYLNSDCRTARKMGLKYLGIDPKKTMKREGTYHSALDDAIFQAQWVSEIHRQFNKRTNPHNREVVIKEVSNA